MRFFLAERMSFDQLFRVSDPKRVHRAITVRGPPLKIDSYQDAEYFIFNFKSYPSTTGLRHRGYLKFLRPLRGNARGKPLQHLDVMVDCTCLSGDSLVLVEDGTYKPIKDIKVGDMVYTHKGRLRPVTHVKSRNVKQNENVYSVQASGFPLPMTVTGLHPFYTLRGNEFCLCGCGQKLERSHSKVKNRTWSPELLLALAYKQGHFARGTALKNRAGFSWVTANELLDQEWFLSPWVDKKSKVLVNSNYARLVGYYVAEGCIPHKRGNEVRLTFNVNEKKTLAADVQRICRELGYRCKQYHRSFKHQRWLTVSIYNKDFRVFCRDHVGTSSKIKKLSNTIMAWDKQALRNVFIGAVLGDGWLDPARGVKYFSSSWNLVCQFSLVLSQLRIAYGVSCHQKQPDKTKMFQLVVPRGKSAETVRQWLWPFLRKKDKRIKVSGSLHGYELDVGQFRALRNKVKVSYSGRVYDITVAEDESFVAHGIVLHNCPDYKFRFAWANKQRQAGQVGHQSLNQAWNRAPRITNPASRPGLCKHILAARSHVYGLVSQFPGGQKDAAIALNQLTKYATTRWTDFPGEMEKGREREARYQAGRAARNIGRPPDEEEGEGGLPVPQVPPVLPQSPGGASAWSWDPATKSYLPKSYASGVAPPGQRGRVLPPPLPPPLASAPALAVPPGQRGRNLPPSTPAEKPGLKSKARTRKTECVDRLNGIDRMNALEEAIKLVEELESDAEGTTALMPPDTADAGGLPGSEPPIDDSVIGADTEGVTAISLLQDIKTELVQLNTALAPEEEEGKIPDESGTEDEAGDELPEEDSEVAEMGEEGAGESRVPQE